MTKFFKIFKTIFFVSIGVYIFDHVRVWLSGTLSFGTLSEELVVFSIYFLYSFGIGLPNIWLIDRLQERYSWREEPLKRAVLGFLGAVVVSMLSIALLRIFTVLVIEQKTWEYFLSHESYFVYIYSLFITFIIVLVFYVIYFYKALTTKKITEQKVIAETETAKYKSLKSQLDPHFLFNSLNVLTSLIEENPKLAEEFTTKLSKTYRYVLEQKEKTLVPLQEELEFAKSYMQLLKMRFEDSLQFELPDHISNPNYKVIPLSLQLLLENVVKHNAISSDKPLRILIEERNGMLVISNNYNKKSTLEKGTGIGLSNIVSRYKLLTNKQVLITKSDVDFSVSLPLLTKNIKIMKSNYLNEEERYNKAVEKVEKIKAFYANLTSYVLVISFLFYVNYTTYWEHKWFLYPMIGWGIGLMFHYFEAFGYYPFISKDWEERKIKQIMDKEL